MLFIPTKKQWKSWSLPSKLTAIGTLCGVVGLLLAILSFQSSFFSVVERSSSREQSRFVGNLANIDKAREFEKLLLENDNKYVQIDVECEHEKIVGKSSRCGAVYRLYEKTYYFILATGSQTFNEYWKGGGKPRVTIPVWIHFMVPDGVSAVVANGPLGAGHQRAKGKFAVLKTNSGLAPPDAIYFELTAVNP